MSNESHDYDDDYDDDDAAEESSETVAQAGPGPNQVQCFISKRWVDLGETVEIPYKGAELVRVLKQYAPR